MTAASPPLPAAVAAFLRGLDARARLLADAQAGDRDAARRALAVAAQVFASDAASWPIAQWPQQYWRLLLSVPAMGHAAAPGTVGPLPGIARLAPPLRAAVLLHLVAALEDTDAAAALGIDIARYQQRIRDALPTDTLGQPDVAVWRAWRAAVQRALEPAPAAPALQSLAHARPAPAVATAPRDPPLHPQRRHLRWLWLGVLLCLAALAATFLLHPRARALLEEWRNRVHVEPLPPADPPKARFNAADPALHPDRELLLHPQELSFARELPLLAWLAADAGDVLPAEPPAAQPALSGNADDGIAQRMQAWDRLLPQQRSVQRSAWAEWQALTDDERRLLRDTAARYSALTTAQQQSLRNRYAGLSFDAHRGWHLGPALGRQWPRIAALFTPLDGGARGALLDLLRGATPEDIEALARLAQTTPPEARAELRRDLLAQPPSQRAAWLQARLQR
ncbi:DUF3106 domain-containing protein [Thermomonas paludicola]|uniref:DUF3106 domain-containing protein n=1 Tax=Thermomonas paludicola TaxID=2884874 RepID=UPI002113DCC6|nr:DUF3106 domain-containing protein [Thermomonas paludicola]